ncbi:uncharacterized protein METZ01_LOCUS401458, partial [marine metagenome]
GYLLRVDDHDLAYPSDRLSCPQKAKVGVPTTAGSEDPRADSDGLKIILGDLPHPNSPNR